MEFSPGDHSEHSAQSSYSHYRRHRLGENDSGLQMTPRTVCRNVQFVHSIFLGPSIHFGTCSRGTSTMSDHLRRTKETCCSSRCRTCCHWERRKGTRFNPSKVLQISETYNFRLDKLWAFKYAWNLECRPKLCSRFVQMEFSWGPWWEETPPWALLHTSSLTKSTKEIGEFTALISNFSYGTFTSLGFRTFCSLWSETPSTNLETWNSFLCQPL